MFGKAMKKQVSITSFKRGGYASVGSNFNGQLTKKEVLKRVSEWWDDYGTGLDDYDGIQITVRKENHGEETKGN